VSVLDVVGRDGRWLIGISDDLLERIEPATDELRRRTGVDLDLYGDARLQGEQCDLFADLLAGLGFAETLDLIGVLRTAAREAELLEFLGD